MAISTLGTPLPLALALTAWIMAKLTPLPPSVPEAGDCHQMTAQIVIKTSSLLAMD